MRLHTWQSMDSMRVDDILREREVMDRSVERLNQDDRPYLGFEGVTQTKGWSFICIKSTGLQSVCCHVAIGFLFAESCIAA